MVYHIYNTRVYKPTTCTAQQRANILQQCIRVALQGVNSREKVFFTRSKQQGECTLTKKYEHGGALSNT